MIKISNFNAHSGFGAFKNDNKADMSLVLSNGTTINDGETRVFQTTLAIGTQDASIRARMNVDGGDWYVARSLIFTIPVTYSGFGADTLFTAATISRISPTTVRLYVSILNNGGALMTLNATKTINAHISTFLSPFQ